MTLRNAAAVSFLLVFSWLVACGDDADQGHPWDVQNSCGDGAATVAEACDGDDLRGRTCESFGYQGGQLGCNDRCTGFLVGQCTGTPDWSRLHGSTMACFECADDEVCLEGRCVPACRGEAVGSERLDFDVSTHSVTVQLSQGGGGSVGTSVAGLEFVNAETREFGRQRIRAEAGQGGEYTADLLDGTYDIYAVVNGSAGVSTIDARIASNVVVDARRTLQIDIPEVVRVDLTLALPEQVPAEDFRGTLVVERIAQGDAWDDPGAVTKVSEIITGGDAPTISVETLAGRVRSHVSLAQIDSARLPGAVKVMNTTTVTADESLTGSLELFTVSGRVRVADGLPDDAAGITVRARQLVHNGDGPSTTAAADGRFAMLLPRGHYRVSATLPDLSAGEYGTDAADVFVEGDTGVDLTLGEGMVPVSGRLEVSNGTPAINFIHFYDPQHAYRRFRVRPRDGLSGAESARIIGRSRARRGRRAGRAAHGCRLASGHI